MPRVTELWAWVVADSAPDDEGVPAHLNPSTMAWEPLMGADRDRALSLRPEAEKVAAMLGKPVKLVRSVGELEVVTVVGAPGTNGKKTDG